MKFLKVLISLFFIVLFTSCTQETDDNFSVKNAEKKATKIDFSQLDLSNLKINLQYSPNDIVYPSTDIQDIKKHLFAEIDLLNSELNNRIEKDKDTDVIVFQMDITSEGYRIYNWKFLSENQLNRSSGDPVLETAITSWECPSGSTQVRDVCTNYDCVVNTIATALQDFGLGDTYTLTLHYSIWGVTVCVQEN